MATLFTWYWNADSRYFKHLIFLETNPTILRFVFNYDSIWSLDWTLNCNSQYWQQYWQLYIHNFSTWHDLKHLHITELIIILQTILCIGKIPLALSHCISNLLRAEANNITVANVTKMREKRAAIFGLIFRVALKGFLKSVMSNTTFSFFAMNAPAFFLIGKVFFSWLKVKW